VVNDRYGAIDAEFHHGDRLSAGPGAEEMYFAGLQVFCAAAAGHLKKTPMAAAMLVR